MEPNLRLKDTIMEIVENQLRDNSPPETKVTYDSLLAKGYSDQEARELIGTVVTSEIHDVLKSNKPFDEARFIKALRRLPRLPWE